VTDVMVLHMTLYKIYLKQSKNGEKNEIRRFLYEGKTAVLQKKTLCWVTSPTKCLAEVVIISMLFATRFGNEMLPW